MRPNNYLTRDKRTEYLKEKTEKEKQVDDNDENEEEEDDEEDDEKNKDNTQKSRTFQSSRPVINKDVKSTIISRDERSKLTTTQNSQTFNRQRIIYARNQDNSNLKESSNIRGGEQDKNQTITPASRIIAKTNYASRTNQNQTYNLRLNQNSSRGQLNTHLSQSNSNTQLRSQNPQTQIRSQIPTKTETQQTQAPQYNRYTRRVIESTVHKEDNNKEIKFINRNNNNTINVTNNNNTINVTNNNDINSNRDKNEKEQEEEKEKTEPKREIRKEPRIDYRKEHRIQEREREVINKKENEKDNYNINNNINNNKKEEENEIKESDVVVKEKSNNTSQIENKKENEIGSQLTDRRKEYVTNDTMIKNGVEIVEFTPEETQRVLEKKAENGEMKKRKKEKKLFKKKKQKKAKIHNNNTNDYYEKNTYNFHKPYETFYKRGKDNFSKRIISDREFYSKRNIFVDYNKSFDYEDSFEDYNNKSISGLGSYNDNRRGYMKRYDWYDNDNLLNRRINNFYDRGRPNPIRGFRGRRGGRY